MEGNYNPPRIKRVRSLFNKLRLTSDKSRKYKALYYLIAHLEKLKSEFF